jgi:hypothetical protein
MSRLFSRRSLHRASLTMGVGLSTLAMLATTVVGTIPGATLASSHREAPLISQDPAADNTDLYAFVSPDKPNTVTIIANYIGLEEPSSGPNFPSFGDDVRYQININNTGTGGDDISYHFMFHTLTRNPETFLYNTGPITGLDSPNWNRPQSYTVWRVTRGADAKEKEADDDNNNHSVVLGRNIPTPPANIGPRSTPLYAALASAAVTDLPGGIKVFAGSRDDPFFVDLGSIFDLAGLRPFNAAHLIPLPTTKGRDNLSGLNVHTIAMQIPISQLKGPHGEMTIGIYASSSRRSMRVLQSDGTVANRGPWVQVSRLGEPLINEVVIPLSKKDYWNASDPAGDAQFAKYYLNPEVSRLENLLYGGALQHIDVTNRTDLVAILLTGVPGLNFTGKTQADFLRLNMDIKPGGPKCLATPSRLGVLDGDFCGFPNGRRLADDVVDIELRAFAQGYGPILNTALGLPNKTPNNLLGDSVDADTDATLLTSFPYVGLPHQGYESVPHPLDNAN